MSETHTQFVDQFNAIQSKHAARMAKLDELKAANSSKSIGSTFDQLAEDVEFTATDLLDRLNTRSANEAALKQIESRLSGQLDADLQGLYEDAVTISKALLAECDQKRDDAIKAAKEAAAAAGLNIEVPANQIDEAKAAIPDAASYGDRKANFVNALASYLGE
jgi:hypothetical protein